MTYRRDIDTSTSPSVAGVSTNDNEAYTSEQKQQRRRTIIAMATTKEDHDFSDDIPRRVRNSASMDSLVDRTIRNSIGAGAGDDLAAAIEVNNLLRRGSDGWSLFDQAETEYPDEKKEDIVGGNPVGRGSQHTRSPSSEAFSSLLNDIETAIEDEDGPSSAFSSPRSKNTQAGRRDSAQTISDRNRGPLSPTVDASEARRSGPQSSRYVPDYRDDDDWFVGEDFGAKASKPSYHCHRKSAPSGSSILSEGSTIAELLSKTADETMEDGHGTKSNQNLGAGPSSSNSDSTSAQEQTSTASKKLKLEDPEFLSKVYKKTEQSRRTVNPSRPVLSNTSSSSSTSSSRPGTSSHRPLASLPAASFQSSSRNYIERKANDAANNSTLRSYRSASSLSRQYAQGGSTGTQYTSAGNFAYASQPTTPFTTAFTPSAQENVENSSLPARHQRGLSSITATSGNMQRSSSTQRPSPINTNSRSRTLSLGTTQHNIMDNEEASTSQESVLPTYRQALTQNHVLYTPDTALAVTSALTNDGDDFERLDFEGRPLRTPATPRRNFFSRIFSRSGSGSSRNGTGSLRGNSRRTRSRQNSVAELDAPPAYDEIIQVPDGVELAMVPDEPREPNLDCRSCQVRYPFSSVVQSPNCGCTYCKGCMKNLFINAMTSALNTPSPSSSSSNDSVSTPIPVVCCSAEIPVDVVSQSKILSDEEVAQYVQLVNDLRSEHDHLVALQMSEE